MHNYLKAVGFSDINCRSKFDRFVDMMLDKAEEKYVIPLEDGISFVEAKWKASDDMGICLRGEYDEDGKFHLEHYFPFCESDIVSTNDFVLINKRVDTGAYIGMCDDYRLGVSLIFYLQNNYEYIMRKKKKVTEGVEFPIKLSALSVSGKVLMPVKSVEGNESYKKIDPVRRNKLIAEAKKGNQEAIDSLTIDDIDQYAIVSRRIRYEDLYSIIETSFIPYGSESDNYSIIGVILAVHTMSNKLTGEQVYRLEIDCNDVMFQVCINKDDLYGEPEPGRRFKGNVWMQGMVDFSI